MAGEDTRHKGNGGTEFNAIGWYPHRPKRNLNLSVGVPTDRNVKGKKRKWLLMPSRLKGSDGCGGWGHPPLDER